MIAVVAKEERLILCSTSISNVNFSSVSFSFVVFKSELYVSLILVLMPFYVSCNTLWFALFVKGAILYTENVSKIQRLLIWKEYLDSIIDAFTSAGI